MQTIALNKETDLELIRAFKLGDKRAGEELIERHYPRILKFCCQRLRSNDDGKDVAQNVFFKVMVEKKIFEFRGQARLATWLIRIAINACNSQFSRYQRRQINFSEYSKTQIVEDSIPCSCPNPEEHYSHDESVRRLNALLLHLPEKYRQALCSTYLENRSYREAAQLLGIPVTALGVHILRGKKMLSMIARSQQSRLKGLDLKWLQYPPSWVDAA